MNAVKHSAAMALASTALVGLALAGAVHADDERVSTPPSAIARDRPDAAIEDTSPTSSPFAEVRAPTDGEASHEFIRVEGTRFVLNHHPFYFVGANVGVLHGRPQREAMERTLDAVRADGLRVIRIWAVGERPADAPAWARDFAFRIGEEGWIESSFEQLDRVLVAARERGLRVIVVLANRWRDYGGIPQYLRWAGLPFDDRPPASPSEYELAAFWSCARCEASYRAHVERVVGRTNALTGVPYREDPTILGWELVNEASAPPRAAPALIAWMRRNAQFVHGLDPNHLVSAGHIGYERSSERATWLAVQRLPEIDYCDAHAYPTSFQRVSDLHALRRFVDDRVQLAHHVVRKPFVWGEFGFSTQARRLLGIPRARWYREFLRASHRDGVAGAMVWIYVPEGDHRNPHGIHPDGEGARRTADVRAVLAREARRWARTPPDERNPALGPRVGERPLWERVVEVRGPGTVHAGVRESEGILALRIAIDGFERARFESAGLSNGGAVTHLWGAGRGSVRYRFRSPARADASQALEIAMRASSELPGPGRGGTDEDGSRVVLSIDGVPLGELDLPVDDGVGRWVSLRVLDRRTIASIFARRRLHRLEIAVVPGIGAEGLCLYGAPTGHESLPPEVAAGLPGAIEIRWELGTVERNGSAEGDGSGRRGRARGRAQARVLAHPTRERRASDRLP